MVENQKNGSIKNEIHNNGTVRNGVYRQEIAARGLKERLKNITNETSAQINQHLEKMVAEVVADLQEKESLSERTSKLLNNNYDDEINDKIKTKEGHLPDKHFTERNSMLTDLLKIKHIQTIYHIFVAIMFGLFVNTVTYDLLHKGKANLGFDLIFRSFSNIGTLFFVWICMFLSSILLYIGFYFWSSIRIQLPPKCAKLKIWDRLFFCTFLIYLPGAIYFYTSIIVSNHLSVVERSAALCEGTRFVMKTYAFVRSNIPRALAYKINAEDAQIFCPEFAKYIYFLFVPTLIYKDNYPRTKHVKWSYVFFNFLEVFGCVVYISFILERFFVSTFEDFGKKSYKWQDITMAILGNGMAGTLILLCIFYGLLHAWMNGFAEMLRFGDRMFYKDWWTSTTYGRWYRTWNVIVHDWLYNYIYKDMHDNVCAKNKLIPKLMVFFISALVHEYIIGFAFGFCYPILFILFFGMGLAFSFIKLDHSMIGNSAMWYTLAVGMGTGLSTFSMEYYARLNCPMENETVIDYFIPRSFKCNLP